MVINIALKEFHANLLTARFTIGFLLCLFLVPFTLFVSINDYKERVSIYEMQKREAEKANQVRVYSALRPEVVKPPEPLGIFSRGISGNFRSKVKIWLRSSEMYSTEGANERDNPFLNAFFSLDFCSILAIVISLLALLFTYDACSGEREQGTLKLTLSNSLSRSSLLLGKVIGACLTLLPILIFCYILSFLVILLSPHVSFSPAEWVRVGLLFLTSIMLFLWFIFLGLFISSRFRSSTAGIIVCLFVWVILVFIVPNLSIYAAQSFIKAPSHGNLRTDILEISSESWKQLVECHKSLEPPDWNDAMHTWGGRDGHLEILGGSASYMEYYRLFNQCNGPPMIEWGEKAWAVKKSFYDALDRQRTFAEAISLISPTEVFRLTASMLCGTDADSYQRFIARCRAYRDEFISWFNDKKIFSSYEYFTPQPPETFKTADEIVRIRTGGEFNNLEEYQKWQEAHDGDQSPIFKVDIPGTNYDDYQPLDLAEMPKFRLERASFAQDIKQAFVGISVLVCVGLLLFYLSFISFVRYDVR